MSTVPLPPPDLGSVQIGRETQPLGHSDEAMRAYGAACAAAERERCAKVCDALWDNSKYGQTAFGIGLCAEAIRNMEPT